MSGQEASAQDNRVNDVHNARVNPIVNLIIFKPYIQSRRDISVFDSSESVLVH